MTEAIKWYPPKSGAMQPNSRPNKAGSLVFCCFCQTGTFVKTFGYGVDKPSRKNPELSIKKTVWECPGCKKQLWKHQLILDLVKWRVFNGHEPNYTGFINPYKEEIEKTLQRQYWKQNKLTKD